MGSMGNNTNGKFSHLRDTFFGVKGFSAQGGDLYRGNGEASYLRELLGSSEEAKALYQKYLTLPPEILYEQAKLRIDMIDNGQIENDKLELVEAEIALFLGAIEDLQLIKTLELTPSDNTHEDGGMSR